jgi:hypothetical protein
MQLLAVDIERQLDSSASLTKRSTASRRRSEGAGPLWIVRWFVDVEGRKRFSKFGSTQSDLPARFISRVLADHSHALADRSHALLSASVEHSIVLAEIP